jgi:hypothetical protein
VVVNASPPSVGVIVTLTDAASTRIELKREEGRPTVRRRFRRAVEGRTADAGDAIESDMDAVSTLDGGQSRYSALG